ncbi:SRPBCC family protein [Mesobacillus foraminis]|uniref:SRPBCC family protein n=1 Tax=Mesobacillus foraminis TaxID=279826 RepID=UPI00214C7821|nr:SRPBCC family protein [Mesobacillus foraminis]
MFEVKKDFHATQEETYRGLLDLDSARNWMQGLVRIERLDQGQMQTGSEWRETRKMFGKEATEHFEVVQLHEPVLIVLRCDGTKGTTGKGEFLFTYKIAPAGDVSKVTLHGEINGLTGLAKVFGKMMAGSFKKACEKDLDALKGHLEK